MNESFIPSKDELEDYIKSEYSRTRTSSTQADIVDYCLKMDADYVEDQKVKTSEILNNVEGARRSHVKNLVNKVGLLKEIKPQGNDNFFWHGRLGETYYSLSEAEIQDIETDINNFLNHVERDSELREFVAEELEVSPTIREIRNCLPRDELNDLVQKFDGLVKKIKRESNVEPSEHGYEEMGWRRKSNRYQVTSAIEEVRG